MKKLKGQSLSRKVGGKIKRAALDVNPVTRRPVMTFCPDSYISCCSLLPYYGKTFLLPSRIISIHLQCAGRDIYFSVVGPIRYQFC